MTEDGEESKETEDGGESKEESKPDVNVLRCRYQELLDELDSQKESWEKEGEHNRRMFRLTLVFIGIIVTGLSTGGIEEFKSAVLANPQCAVFTGPACLPADYLLFAAILALVTATTFYIRGASGGLLVGSAQLKDDIFQKGGQRELADFEDESDYLSDKIGILEASVEYNYEQHLSSKVFERAGAVSLLISISSFLILAYAIASGSPVGKLAIYTGTGFVTIILVLLDWRSSYPVLPFFSSKEISDSQGYD